MTKLTNYHDGKLGVIEQGASWLPSWLRYMDSAFHAFQRREERLQKLSLLPSEFAKRQVRATPYPAEDVGWIICESGDDMCLFSSDFPHEVNNETCKKELQEMRENEEMSDEDKAAILHGNAERFYNLTPISS